VDDAERDALIARLPDDAAELMRQAFAAKDEPREPLMDPKKYPGLIITQQPAKQVPAGTLTRQALEAVGYPHHHEPFPLPEDLDETQRVLATLTAELDVEPHAFAIPTRRWSRRRWLGIDPPGVLEKQVRWEGRELPIWRVLVELDELEQDEAEAGAEKLFATLEPTERVRVWGESALGAYRGFDFLVKASLEDVDGSLGAWAVEMADRLPERRFKMVQDAELRMVWAGLVRGGVTIEERWDALFPRPGRLGAKHRREVLSWLEAIPEDRRGGALAAAHRRGFASSSVPAALSVVEAHPYPDFVEMIIERADELGGGIGPSRRKALETLVAMTRKAPAVRARAKEALAALGEGVVLKCAKAFRPKGWDDLDEPRTAQMKHCEKMWSVNWGPLEGSEETTGFEYTSVFHVNDENDEPLFDVVLMMDEDGSVFRAGTMEEVGYMVQMNLHLEPRPMKEALQALLREHRPPK